MDGSTERRWPSFYEKTRNRPAWPLVIEAAALAPGRRALDLGAGAGRDTRYLLEQGFEVAVVRDATAGPRHPTRGDGYLAALVNFAFLAHAVPSTAEMVATMATCGPSAPGTTAAEREDE